MAPTGMRCLHTQLETPADTADNGKVDEVRVRLTSMLRCASHLSCSDAVNCSDDAMTQLRRVLCNSETRD